MTTWWWPYKSAKTCCSRYNKCNNWYRFDKQWDDDT